MKFVPLEINGVQGIIEKRHSDSRGSLTRIWDADSILSSFDLKQSSVVLNPSLGTLRGLHFQLEPYTENKIVECISGKVFDVIVDLRENSPTYCEYIGLEIGPLEKFLGLFIPAGCAHGYLTLEQNSNLIYFMDKTYSKQSSRGLPWNDPSLKIEWPTEPIVISERDRAWPALDLNKIEK